METATAEIDPTTGLPFDDVRVRNIRHDVDRPLIDNKSDPENIQAATKLTGFGEKARVFEWSGAALRESGPSESAHAQARRAANMMGNKRRDDFANRFQQHTGVDADTAHQVSDIVATDPAMPVLATRTDGTHLPPLRDDVPVLDQVQDGNDIPRSQLKLAGKNFRDAQALERENLLFELGQQQAASDEQNVREAMAASRVERGEQPAAQPQVQAPQPQRQDVVSQREAAAAQAHQTAAAIAQMTQAEAALWTDISRHEAEVFRAYPEASSHEAFKESRKNNPARIEALLHEKQRSDAAKAQLQALTTNRQTAQAQIAQRQREQQFQANDNAFNQWLSKAHPNYSKGARRTELQQAVKSYLRDDLGMTDQDIDYHYKQSGLLRSAQAQAMLANGAMWKLSQQAAKRIAEKRVHGPPVQKPGVARPRGADNEDSVRSLQRQLETASGQKALRIATELTKALRR